MEDLDAASLTGEDTANAEIVAGCVCAVLPPVGEKCRLLYFCRLRIFHFCRHRQGQGENVMNDENLSESD